MQEPKIELNYSPDADLQAESREKVQNLSSKQMSALLQAIGSISVLQIASCG